MAHMPDELIPTRATLIQRLKDWQDQPSWQEFFDTYWNLIYGVAIKRGLTKTEAQEVVQETLISVAKYMPGFKYDPALGSFKSWLLNLTRWRISDQIRQRQPSVVYYDPPNETNLGDDKGDKNLNQPIQNLDTLWDDEWEHNLLNVAIAKARRRLDPKQFQIFDFYVNKGWDPERIAQTFSISVNLVYVAKHRVAEMIKEESERLKRDII